MFAQIHPGLPFFPNSTELLVKCLALPRKEREGRHRRVAAQPDSCWEDRAACSRPEPLPWQSPSSAPGFPEVTRLLQGSPAARTEGTSGPGASPEVRGLHPDPGVLATSYVALRKSLSSPGLQASLSPAKHILFLFPAEMSSSWMCPHLALDVASQAESLMTRKKSNFSVSYMRDN